jgi:hypothetical protein
MSEVGIFAWKTAIIVLAIPLTFLLVYLTGLLIAKIASKYCPNCKKRKKDDKLKWELMNPNKKPPKSEDELMF